MPRLKSELAFLERLARFQAFLAATDQDPIEYLSRQLLAHIPTTYVEQNAVTYLTFSRIWEPHDLNIAILFLEIAQQMSPTPEGAAYLARLTSFPRPRADRELTREELAMYPTRADQLRVDKAVRARIPKRNAKTRRVPKTVETEAQRSARNAQPKPIPAPRIVRVVLDPTLVRLAHRRPVRASYGDVPMLPTLPLTSRVRFNDRSRSNPRRARNNAF
jgi:hypothetical protein